MKKFWLLLAFVLLLPLFGVEGVPADSENFFSTMVPMRDGVKLFTTIEIPSRKGRYPVILLRNLYRDRRLPVHVHDGIAKRDYIFIHQDVRGAGRSEGEWTAWVNEGKDGADTIAWIAKQPWCNGKIAMTGGSYSGSSQLLVATYGQPELKAIYPKVATGNFFNGGGGHYQGGVPNLSIFSWLRNNYVRLHSDADFDKLFKVDFLAAPLLERDLASGANMQIPFWRTIVTNDVFNDFWREIAPGLRADEFTCPAFHLGGWYDIFTQETLDMFMKMRTQGKNERVRKFTRCIMGPYTHTGVAKVPGLKMTRADRKKMERYGDKFLLGLLKDENRDPLPELPPLTYFVTGANEWRASDVWPPKESAVKPMFLGGTNANTAAGGGILSWEKIDSTPDVFVSDPKNPVRSRGGHWGSDVKEQMSVLGKRKDVLFYYSDVLEKPLEIVGRIKVRLFASCSTPDTDFAVKLADYGPDGKAYNLANGILRARYRKSDTVTELLVPNQVYEFEIDLWSIAHRLEVGHKLLLIVAGQDFGYFALNRNTGKNPATDTEYQQAKITIFHDKDHPSAVLLPIFQKSDSAKVATKK